jgi:hypothetical protein
MFMQASVYIHADNGLVFEIIVEGIIAFLEHAILAHSPGCSTKTSWPHPMK